MSGAASGVRVLFVEDSSSDVALALAALRRSGFEPAHEVVETEEDLRAALARAPWDVVLTDYYLPGLDGLEAIRIVHAFDPDLPCVLVSGRLGEDFAVAAMRAGANDYLLKDNLARLGPTIDRELRDAALRRENRRMEQEQRSYAEVHRFLAEAGAVLGRVLDVEPTIREACRLAVPRLADHAVAYLVEDGILRVVAQAHAGAAPALPGGGDDAPLVREVLGSGAPALLCDAPIEGLGSCMIVPLRGRSGMLGALLFARAAPGRRYSERELAVAEDFGGRVGLALENARLYQQAQQAVRVRDRFLAMLGHELRNPLAPILTATHLMKQRGGNHLGRELAVIERQARHLVRLVDDLLDISRITQGKIQLCREPLEVATAVAAAIEIASPLIEQRRHRLHVEVPAAGLLVSGDAQRLAQVIANLLTNAAKFTDPGGDIRVHARRVGAEIALSVTDTGAGIPPDLLGSLFEAFVQGEQALDRRNGGLGLGLSLVRSLTELHGGRVTAHSDGPGRGSEFVVYLPALGAAEAPDAADAAPRAAGAVGAESTRVLIVDDNADAAGTLAEALRVLGFEVRVAPGALEALACLESFRADVAVLDIGLPVMDGYTLARRLRGRFGRSLRLVAVTGYGHENDKARAAAAGFDAHLVKPVELPTFVQAIRAL